MEISKNYHIKESEIIGGRIFESKEKPGEYQICFKMKGTENPEFTGLMTLEAANELIKRLFE